MGLIDFHAHLAPSTAARDRLLATMDRLNISRCAVVAGGLQTPQEISYQINFGRTKSGQSGGSDRNVSVPNESIFQLCGRDRRLLPFYFANPHEESDDYVRAGKKYYGLKLGPAIHGVALTDERHRELVAQAGTFGHPVYLHCLGFAGFDVEALLRLARAFPDVNFVLGHAGNGNCDFFAVDAIQPCANIYFETSGGFSSVIAYAVQRLGLTRILFGSEYPLQEPSLEIAKMGVLKLPFEALNRNASLLLGLEATHG